MQNQKFDKYRELDPNSPDERGSLHFAATVVGVGRHPPGTIRQRGRYS
jgi:hypothetical protein